MAESAQERAGLCAGLSSFLDPIVGVQEAAGSPSMGLAVALVQHRSPTDLRRLLRSQHPQFCSLTGVVCFF